MSDEQRRLEQEIAQLHSAIANLEGLPESQTALRTNLHAKEAALAKLTQPSDTQSFSANRDVNVATNQTINNFFGGQPGEDGERLLADYLTVISGECDQLRLYRLTGRRQTGGEHRAAPALRLQHVYTSLTTNGRMIPVHQRERTAQQSLALFKRIQLERWAPDIVSPEHVRILGSLNWSADMPDKALDKIEYSLERSDSHVPMLETLSRLPLTTPVKFILSRSELALEAIARCSRLVLLGEPGSGKSTALRYLTLLLARRCLGENVSIPGWPPDRAVIPILCPLGAVAAALANHQGDADQALWAVLGTQLDGAQGIRAGLHAYLKGAIRRGSVLLLFDGLDELPIGPRALVSKAVARLAEQTNQSHCVVTCRVLPYSTPGDWQLPDDRWDTRTIQPLVFGQVRTFVHSWYNAIATDDPELSQAEANQRIESLTRELEQRERLRPLLRSPLLLTMLAILHYNNDEVPGDRSRLYEECIQLLLERWEPVRTPGQDRPGLPERIGLPNLEIDQLRTVLHRLAFQAHDRPPDDDGRGLLDGASMEGELTRFFRPHSANPDAITQAFLAALAEDAGLLQARADDRYAFPHLTFQEYLAACYLADLPTEMSQLAYQRWSGPESARWHEALLLLAGRLRRQGAKAIERDGLPWLELLMSRRVGRANKPDTQRRRDAVLATQSYTELGGSAAFANSLFDPETKIEQPLRAAIIDLLSSAEPHISTLDRITAAQVLGQLGDQRYPITPEAWQHELAHRSHEFGKPNGYFCYLPDGTYTIGGWDYDEVAADLSLPTFWVGRMLITVQQYRQFIEAGGYTTKQYWTPEGWKWKGKHSTPRYWNNPQFNQPNQPVIGVTWYEATAFCNWLTDQLQQELPANYVVRLPTDAEWETATSYDGSLIRRTYPWGTDEPSTTLAIYDQLQLQVAAPVGCCPAGIAACGALDVAGNVWEWTASQYLAYPEQSNQVIMDILPEQSLEPEEFIALRGCSYYHNRTYLPCGARVGSDPSDSDNGGFRIVVAPRIIQ